MSESFRFVALDPAPFMALDNQTDSELRAAGARRLVVDGKPGSPCRVSLVDAEVGETVLLFHYLHHDVTSPYRASGPIIVRQGAKQATPAAGEIPVMFHHRKLSIRGYDDDGMLVDSEVVDGARLEDAIGRSFADLRVRYLHLHNAGPGCYNCRVDRA